MQQLTGSRHELHLCTVSKVSDLFASPHLPLDADYSYAARAREAERQRKAQATLFGIKLTD